MSGVKRLVRYHEPHCQSRLVTINWNRIIRRCHARRRPAPLEYESLKLSAPRISRPSVKDRVAIDHLGSRHLSRSLSARWPLRAVAEHQQGVAPRQLRPKWVDAVEKRLEKAGEP